MAKKDLSEQQKTAALVREALYGRDGGLQAFARYEGAHEALAADHARLIDLHAEQEIALKGALDELAAAKAKLAAAAK